MPYNRRWLIVTRAGASSLHDGWLIGHTSPKFDLLISAYDKPVFRSQTSHVDMEYRPGSKVAGYAALFRDRPELLQHYDRIALIDDDIATDVDTLNRMFQLAEQYDLKIAQPALTRNSHFTFAALLAQPSLTLRYVNYIEMMCPVFRSDALETSLPLFEMGFESGIDLIWCNLLDAPERSFAVLDACPVHHTRSVGRAKALNGFKDGRRYEDDIYALLRQFDLPWLPCLPYAAIDGRGRLIDGQTITGRLRLWISALQALVALPGPYPKGRARKILVHWHHLLRKTPRNLPRQMPGL
ncbi:MAG: hypothetical protein AB3N23_03875 [Paracoccaceae bacterium]